MKDISKEEKFLITYINKQFEVAGHEMDYQGLKDSGLFDDQVDEGGNWYNKYTWNQDQEDELREWFLSDYAKTFKVNKNKGKDSATEAWAHFNNTWGLTRNDYEDIED